MLSFLQKHGASLELAELIVELANAVARIGDAIDPSRLGEAGSQNAFGEEQAKLDVQAEEIIQAHVKTCPFVAAFCSEELDTLQSAHEGGRYSVFYDPLDGSSLIDVNQSVGTIVGIYEGADVMGRTAREQVAALYGQYGPLTTLVVTVGQGVHEFTLVEGAWQLTTERMELRGEKNYFAPGNLRATSERPEYLELINSYITQRYTLRYSGGMVPDINHMLKKGSGIFIYPGGVETYPQGKLRLLYECGPMAMIVEQAGGAASAGTQAVLDVRIESLTQRTPIYVGVKAEVERCVAALSSESL